MELSLGIKSSLMVRDLQFPSGKKVRRNYDFSLLVEENVIDNDGRLREKF